MQEEPEDSPILNCCLKPESLFIRVPKKCDWRSLAPYGVVLEKDQEEAWKAYLETLGDDDDQPVGGEALDNESWKLTGKRAIEHARRVHAKVHRQILRYPSVSAVDVGFAIRELPMKFINVLAIRIHIDKKIPKSLLTSIGAPNFGNLDYAKEKGCGPGCTCAGGAEPVAVTNGKSLLLDYPISGIKPDDLSRLNHLPGNIDERCRLCILGVPIDLVEARYFPSSAGQPDDGEVSVYVNQPRTSRQISMGEQVRLGRSRVEPLVGGVSVGSANGPAGTLGALVWDATDGRPCLLSNWHVLAGSLAANNGQPVYQPGVFDGGGSEDVVAHLKRWYLGESGEAAIAELCDERTYATGAIMGMWDPIAGFHPPELNLRVRKWGRTTGFTEGFIDGINLATNLDYGGGIVRHFRNQFHIAPYRRGQDVSQGGDSGSLVLTMIKPEELRQNSEKKAKELEKLMADLSKKLKVLCANREHFGAVCDRLNQASEVETGERKSAIEILEGCLASLEVPDKDGEAASALGATSAQPEACKALLEKLLGLKESQPFDERLRELLRQELDHNGLHLDEFADRERRAKHRHERRVNFAVGMIFAGDTPGSPFGEFALASDLELLAKELQFSLHPVFGASSTLHRIERKDTPSTEGRASSWGEHYEPGEPTADPRGKGPTPDSQSIIRSPGNGGGKRR